MSRSQGRMASVIVYVKDVSAQRMNMVSPCVASQPYLRQDGLAKQLCPGAGALLAGLGYPDHQDGPPLSIPALPSHLHNSNLHTNRQTDRQTDHVEVRRQYKPAQAAQL